MLIGKESLKRKREDDIGEHNKKRKLFDANCDSFMKGMISSKIEKRDKFPMFNSNEDQRVHQDEIIVYKFQKKMKQQKHQQLMKVNNVNSRVKKGKKDSPKISRKKKLNGLIYTSALPDTQIFGKFVSKKNLTPTKGSPQLVFPNYMINSPSLYDQKYTSPILVNDNISAPFITPVSNRSKNILKKEKETKEKENDLKSNIWKKSPFNKSKISENKSPFNKSKIGESEKRTLSRSPFNKFKEKESIKKFSFDLNEGQQKKYTTSFTVSPKTNLSFKKVKFF